MSERIDVFRSRFDGVVIPRIWVTFGLSILLHVVALLVTSQAPKLFLPPSGEDPDARTALSLRLMPPAPSSSPAIPAPSLPSPEPALRAQRPKAPPRPQPAPPVIAMNKPVPGAPSIAPPVTVPQPRPTVEGDLDAYIEARRRARGEPAPAAKPPVDDDEGRRQRIIAGNLGSSRERTFGYDPRQGGGMFQIQSLGSDYAEFIFYGWSKDIGRNTKQVIAVPRGNHSDIRVAVVRRMIALIRENTQEDFLWVSQRLGRSVMLSAHPRDNAGLEEFMMREFFYDATPAQR